MSDIYVQRLRAIRAEKESVENGLRLVLSRWDDLRPRSAAQPGSLKQEDFRSAVQKAEGTYLVRLHAEFEGILKDHLTTNHNGTVHLPKDPKIDWLISKTFKAEKLSIDPNLRQKIELVRDSRNRIAHADRSLVLPVPFNDALSWFVRVVSSLPDPR